MTSLLLIGGASDGLRLEVEHGLKEVRMPAGGNHEPGLRDSGIEIYNIFTFGGFGLAVGGVYGMSPGETLAQLIRGYVKAPLKRHNGAERDGAA